MVLDLLSRTGGLLEGCDVELDHLQHRVGDPLRASRVVVSHPLVHAGGNDLPPETESIDEPTARLGLASPLEERVPVAVQLRLIVAEHDPALIAWNRCPRSVKSTTFTEPAGPLGESLWSGVTRSTRESGKMEA